MWDRQRKEYKVKRSGVEMIELTDESYGRRKKKKERTYWTLTSTRLCILFCLFDRINFAMDDRINFDMDDRINFDRKTENPPQSQYPGHNQGDTTQHPPQSQYPGHNQGDTTQRPPQSQYPGHNQGDTTQRPPQSQYPGHNQGDTIQHQPQSQYPGYNQGDTTQHPQRYLQPYYPPQQYYPVLVAPQYPPVPYYHLGPPPQQGTNIAMVGAGPGPIQPEYQTRPSMSFTGAIILSCFSILCCGNLLLGGIALIVASKWHWIQQFHTDSLSSLDSKNTLIITPLLFSKLCHVITFNELLK